jgi:GTP-binding protein
MHKNGLKIAIVGRPNVGKSLLFNRMCKKRLSIVDEMEGVTRDRIYATTQYFGTDVELIDTAGINPNSKDNFNKEMIAQSEKAIEEADGIILVVDGIVGLNPLDRIVAQAVYKSGKPWALAINKIEGQNHTLSHEFCALGAKVSVEVSAMHGSGIETLFEELLAKIPPVEKDPSTQGMKIAIIGRTNVGKSTLLNAILGEERSIVSDIAGTTRDAIDADVEINGQMFTLIDTAGIRRKHKELDVVEKFAALRTQKAIERADICLFLIDAMDGITTQEKRILTEIEKAQKGCIILANKWDLVKGVRMEHCEKALVEDAPFLSFCPLIFGSAKEKRNIHKIFEIAKEVYDQRKLRIATPDLNAFLERAMQLNHPPMIQGKRLRVYYMTQVEVAPPRFVLFVNYKDRMTESYQRYLENEFRRHFPFKGVPLAFHLKKRKSEANPYVD